MGERVSMHGGRAKGRKHNFREFDTSKVEHINTEKSKDNLYYDLTGGDFLPMPEGFKMPEGEILRTEYDRLYSEGLKRQNERYTRSGHKERCKTLDDLLTNAKTRPNEVILQVGSKNDIPLPADVFCTAVERYVDRVNAFCEEKGIGHRFLSCAIHFDETTPHAHIKETYHAQTKAGILPKQEECFRQAGLPLPKPEEKEGRYNNRKITFDGARREIWQEVCKELGIEVITEPRPSRKRKEKADYIAECQDKRQAVLDATQRSLEGAYIDLGNGEKLDVLELTTALKMHPSQEVIGEYREALKGLGEFGRYALQHLREVEERASVTREDYERNINYGEPEEQTTDAWDGWDGWDPGDDD